jgi:lysophospholipase
MDWNRALVFVHGAFEHVHRYRHLYNAARNRGWSIASVALPGHAESPFKPLQGFWTGPTGPTCDIRSFAEYQQAVRAVLEAVRDCGITAPDRIAVFAHSLGGVIAIRMMQDSPGFLASAVVLSAPFLGEARPQPPWKLALGRLLVRIFPTFPFRVELKPTDLTNDPAVIKAWQTDPLIHTHLTVRWYFTVKAAILQAHEYASRWTTEIPRYALPNMLVVQGTADRVTDADAARRWFDKVPLSDADPNSGVSLSPNGQRNKSWIDIPGGLHECFNDLAWKERFDQVLDWLDRCIPPN